MDESKQDDLFAVLAAVSAAVSNNDPEKARALVTEDFRVDLGRNPCVTGPVPDGTLCGHKLEIVDGERLLVGGGGVVIPCREAGGEAGSDRRRQRREVRYALKVARPSLFWHDPPAQEEEARKARLEYETHLPLSHENIAKMYNYGEIHLPVKDAASFLLKLPCTLIEWVEDALPFNEYVEAERRRPEELADLISQTCRALEHLHGAGMVHWDMKSDNLLVSGAGQVKLMDLGNARPLRDAGETYEKDGSAESTYGHLPPALHVRTPEPGKGEATSGRVSRNRAPCPLKEGEEVWDRPWLDLHMLAREVNRMVAFDPAQLAREPGGADLADAERRVEEIFADEDGKFVREYLRRILERLIDASSPSASAYYTEASEVVEALERLLPEYGAGTDLPELVSVPQHVLRVPPNENIPWTDRISALMGSATLLRLKRHRQLATVRHVFPGAEHSRWEHTIGALGRALQSLRALYADRGSILFRLDTSKLDLTALMVATLLHDVGHPAFGHQLEESPLVTQEHRHEAYAIALLREARDGVDSDPAAAEVRAVLEEHWCSARISVEALLTRAIEMLAGQFEPRSSERRHEDHRVHLELLHSLLVGPLDADKSDYLARDAHHCGVEYATGIDRKRLEQTLTALEVREGPGGQRRGVLGITHKGVLPLESMLVARYQLFRAVYWQHTVRAITVMLQELVEGYVLPRGTCSQEPSERLDDVLRCFRECPDEEAIEWLAEQLQTAGGISAAERSDLARLVEGVLGARTAFPWQALEIAGTDNADPAVYKALREKWKRPERDLDGTATVRERRQLRTQIAAAVASELAGAGLAEVEIREADVLLDVPIAGKDQVTDLFVAPLYGEEPRPVETETTLAPAVAKAFELAVRPVRVFLRPEVGALLGSGPSAEERMSKLVARALRKTVLEQLQMLDDAVLGVS